MVFMPPLEGPTTDAAANDLWWHDDWPYRVKVNLTGSGTAKAQINFTQLFSQLGLNAAVLDPDSLRVVPYVNGLPGTPLPFQETLTTRFLDADTLNTDAGSPDAYWNKDAYWDLSLDSDHKTQGAYAVHAHVQVNAFLQEKSGFYYYFNQPGGVDWSAYELLLYDVRSAVNQSAIDQTPDIYYFELGGLLSCPEKQINGPPLVMETWNTAAVSLKPYGSCPAPNPSALENLWFFIKVKRSFEDYGYFETGDELDLWLDNFRLMDQDGSGEIRWATVPTADSYYIYFDTINHRGHPEPTRSELSDPSLSADLENPEAGGYFHLISGVTASSLSIWHAPTPEKILQTSQAPVTIKPLALSGAKGEFVPVQLVVNAATTRTLAVSASPLAHETATDLIPAENVELFRVDYVAISQLSDFYGRTTAWPDPLYPLFRGEPVLFPAGVNQPLWIRVRIPFEAAPGVYTGTITVGPIRVPYSLKVWNFQLANAPVLDFQVGFDWALVMETYGGTQGGIPQLCYDGLHAAVTASLLDYRISVNNETEPPDDVVLYSLTSYEVEEAHDEQLNLHQRVWWVPSPIDLPPHINPVVTDRPGVESRVLPWLGWLDRVDGIYYPQSTDWDPDPWTYPFSNDLNNGNGFLFYPPKNDLLGFNPCIPSSNRLVPSIRLELLREGLEDYAYLQLLNGGMPLIDQENSADLLARSMVASRTAINRIPTAFDPLRQAIAQAVEERQRQVYLPILLH